MTDNHAANACLPDPSATGCRQRILVVDDDPDCYLVMKDLLKELDYEVDTAQDPSEALALVHRHAYGVALIDVYLKVSDGLTLCRDLRMRAPTIAVIIITGDPDDPRVKRALADGAVAVVGKPLNFPRLQAIIARSLATGEE